jgi:hypothetical protein
MDNQKHIKNFKTAKIFIVCGNIAGALLFFIAYYIEKQTWLLIVSAVLLVSTFFEILLINRMERKLFGNDDGTIP